MPVETGFEFEGFNGQLNIFGDVAPGARTDTERRVASHRGSARSEARKATSELALADALDWHLHEGDCYHVLSWGDVDAMSYVKHVLRQIRAEWVAIVTRAIGRYDVQDLAELQRRGMVGRTDYYVGEILPGQYPEAWTAIQEATERCGGRRVVFRNHAKLALVHGAEDVLVESSANFNTNPRVENTVVTASHELVRWYAGILAEINPFNGDPGAEPYNIDE